jgi:ABC-type Fe3+/spermidine/putrescine transport system ATPase subunit
LRRGEILSILGPSGCGKTTTMRMIAGLDTPTQGDIRLDGRSIVAVPVHQRNIGLVFQSLAVFPHMSVRQNIAFGLRMKKTPKSEIDGRVDQALQQVQLSPAQFADRRPQQLSGGQLQRVALARTIVTEPSLVLLDEPMAALDRRLRDHMAIELRTIQKELGIAAIYVTHDQESASMMSDRLAIMHAGQLVQVGGPAEVYQRPASRFVAEFLGDLNCITATSMGEDPNQAARAALAGTTVYVTGKCGAPLSPLQLVCRPEHVQLQSGPPDRHDLPATIADIQFSAGFFRWRLRLRDGQELFARTPSAPADAAIGTTVGIVIAPCHLRIDRGA